MHDVGSMGGVVVGVGLVVVALDHLKPQGQDGLLNLEEVGHLKPLERSHGQVEERSVKNKIK